MSGVDLQIDDTGIAHLVMTRAEARNALSAQQAADIASAAVEISRDPRVRVTVLRSALPEFFSVGADLKERRRLDSEALMAAREHSLAATHALLSLPMPAVAAVRGMALGGGLELALTCDVIVADDTAVVALPETGIGIIPGGGGTQLLPRRIGAGRAAELIFTGRRLTAAEAHHYGIVDILADNAEAEAVRLANVIASKSPTAQRNAKKALRGGLDRSLSDALACEDACWRESALSADYREGLAAFGEKRTPAWPTPATTTEGVTE